MSRAILESRYLTSLSRTKFFFDWLDMRPLRSRRRFWAVLCVFSEGEGLQKRSVRSPSRPFGTCQFTRRSARRNNSTTAVLLCLQRWPDTHTQATASSQPTSRQLVLYLCVLLCRHAVQRGDRVSVCVSMRFSTPRGPSGAALLLAVVVCEEHAGVPPRRPGCAVISRRCRWSRQAGAAVDGGARVWVAIAAVVAVARPAWTRRWWEWCDAGHHDVCGVLVTAMVLMPFSRYKR